MTARLLFAVLSAVVVLAAFAAGRATASRPGDQSIPAIIAVIPVTAGNDESDPDLRTRAPEPRPTSSPVVVPVPTRAATGAHSLRGVASWFATGPDGLFAAAGPALRVGHWRGRVVRVCAATCVWVTLNDYCGCPGRLIDLSDQAFRRLAPLSVGLITVRVWQ